MISIDESRCNLCGLCVPICPPAILVQGEKSIVVTDPIQCIFCGHCKAICPTDAPTFAKLKESEFEPVPRREELPDPADFLRFLRRRRSLRVYQNKPVGKEPLQKILEAGRFAPTGANWQTCRFTVVGGRKTLDRICTLAIQNLQEEGKKIQGAVERHRRQQEPLRNEYAISQFFPPFWNRLAAKWQEGVDQLLHNAPAVILVHVKKNATLFPELDAGISATHMILMAETLGLGTCFIGFLIYAMENSEELREVLKIPPDHRAYIAFTVGYPDVDFLKLVARKPAKVEWIGEFGQ
jgi:nitroreductase/NAD-dependent dihydropyrimidine dehydrogenase PreA subunit